ncbi:MAG TPA: hypothetical protein VNI57_10295 [Candidatus Saccharimonadales bacterium]|nr:hypothetical protein [Candidatus Saccharimonadales bacterium]
MHEISLRGRHSQRAFRVTLILSIAITSAISALTYASAEVSGGIPFERSRVTSYTSEELVGLLSRVSLDLNFSHASSLVTMAPSRIPDRDGTPIDFSFDNQSMEMTLSSDLPYPTSVIDELVRRKATALLLQTFETSQDDLQLDWVEVALERLRDAQTDAEMSRLAEAGVREHRGYLAVLYFAETGAGWALTTLNCDYYHLRLSSLEKVDVVVLFGKYKHYPAAPTLADTLEAALNYLSRAALKSLKAMYPKGRDQFRLDGLRSKETAARYWKRYIEKNPVEAAPDSCPPKKDE